MNQSINSGCLNHLIRMGDVELVFKIRQTWSNTDISQFCFHTKPRFLINGYKKINLFFIQIP